MVLENAMVLKEFAQQMVLKECNGLERSQLINGWELMVLDSIQCTFFKISKVNDILELKSAFCCITGALQL